MRTDLRLLTFFAAMGLCGCGKTGSGSEQQRAPAPRASVSPRAATRPAPQEPRQPLEVEAPVTFSPVTFEEMQKLDHHILAPHTVVVDLHPYCDPEVQPPGSTERFKRSTWAVREPDWHPLFTKFYTHPDYVSLVHDGERRKIVLLFEPGFTDWASIQEQVPLPRRVPVELRPACHTSSKREAARAIVEKLVSDPARPGIFSWQPDDRINGYRVYVLPGHEKDADWVKERLGSIANVWFSPHFEIVSHGAGRAAAPEASSPR